MNTFGEQLRSDAGLLVLYAYISACLMSVCRTTHITLKLIKKCKKITKNQLKSCVYKKKLYLCSAKQKIALMTFEDINKDGRLWAAHYEGEELNELDRVFTQWNDAGWLLLFLRENFDGLVSYFKIT